VSLQQPRQSSVQSPKSSVVRICPLSPFAPDGTIRREVDLPDPERPSRSKSEGEIDYLVCRDCGSPCYVFEMEGRSVSEAQCLVCGNDAPARFNLGEESGSDDND
jgi:hypothetical protein